MQALVVRCLPMVGSMDRAAEPHSILRLSHALALQTMRVLPCIAPRQVMRKDRILERDHKDYVRAERDVLTAVLHPYIVTLRYSFQARGLKSMGCCWCRRCCSCASALLSR